MTFSTSLPATLPMLMLYPRFHLSLDMMQALRAQFSMWQPSKSHDTPSRPIRLLDMAYDKTLATVLAFTQNGWNIQECHDPDIKPYFIRCYELSIEQGYLIWGLRVIIPPNLREPILKELHWSHPGVARIKSMARSHVWWPQLDSDLERITRACQ